MRIEDTPDPESGHPRRRPALAELCLALAVTTIDNTVLNTALPALAEALPASTADLQWINNAYILVFAATLITAGSLGTRFGHRRALVGGLTVLAMASASAALSGSTGQLVVFRAGVGLVMAPASTATVAAVPREKSPMASSVNSVVRELGGALGIAVVGTVVSASCRSRLATTLPGAPAPAAEDLPSAHLLAAELPPGPAGQLVAAANETFTTAMNHGTQLCALVALVALLGTVAALVRLRRRPVAERPAAEPEKTPEKDKVSVSSHGA
ncbi:MFS transporter [Streptosporangium sp. NPDC003464]